MPKNYKDLGHPILVFVMLVQGLITLIRFQWLGNYFIRVQITTGRQESAYRYPRKCPIFHFRQETCFHQRVIFVYKDCIGIYGNTDNKYRFFIDTVYLTGEYWTITVYMNDGNQILERFQQILWFGQVTNHGSTTNTRQERWKTSNCRLTGHTV